MNRYYYDLHTHSCLSPCADDDNTPCNLAGMATICGINILALTDHNSCRNCPAFFAACKAYGIIPVAGMELTTAEDIHIICLFEELEDALAFGEEIEQRIIKFPNNVSVYGEQMIMDGEDRVVGTVDYLRSNATDIMLEEAPRLVEKHNGICYPAHIDREANGIIATLGTMPAEPAFSCFELHNGEKLQQYTEKYALSGKQYVVCSDTHYLTDMRERENYFLLPDEPYSSAKVRSELFRRLRGEE